MIDFTKILNKIEKLTERDLRHKSISDLYLSAGEEFGELGRAIKVEQVVYGNQHKTLDEPAKSEAVDLLIMAVAIYFATGGSSKKLSKNLQKKLKKWKKNQGKSDAQHFGRSSKKDRK